MTKNVRTEYSKRASTDALSVINSKFGEKFIYLLLVGSVMLFILFPMIKLFTQSILGEDGSLTTSYYTQVWNQYSVSLKNSIFVAVLTALLSTFLSLGVAFILAISKGWIRRSIMGMVLVAMVSPPFVSSLAYIQLYGKRGLITHGLLGLSLDPYNQWGIILMQSISFVALNAVFLEGMLKKIDANVVKSARDLGADASSVIRDVILPMLKPGILVSLLLSFIRSMADFGTPIIIGGRYSTLASEVYLQIVGYSSIEKASAMNMFILIPSIVAFFLYRLLMKKSDDLMKTGRGRQDRLNIGIKGTGIFGGVSVLITLVVFIVIFLQYASILLNGFLKNGRNGYYLTLSNLEKLIELDAATITRSIGYALIVSFVGTLFAMVFAYFMDRRKVKGRHVLDGIVTLPYVIPGICFGIGYILAFNSWPLKITGTAAIVLLNMLFKQLPTTTKICSAALTQIPESLELAARDLGGNQGAVIKDIIIPSMKPAFVSSFVYNFSSSMTTAGAILFLVSPSRKLAVFKLFDSVYRGEYAMASLLATVIILIVLAVEAGVYSIWGSEVGINVFRN
ncbi:MAG: iron ABC transporter permease [Clostridiaceae bacterium]